MFISDRIPYQIAVHALSANSNQLTAISYQLTAIT